MVSQTPPSVSSPVNSTSSTSSTPPNPLSLSVSEVSAPSGSSSNKEIPNKPKDEKKVVDSEERNQSLIAIAESVPLKGTDVKIEWARSILIHHKEVISKYLKEKKVLPIKANWWVENEKEIPEALMAYFDFLEEEDSEDLKG